jgi:hypothetical protein
MYISLGNYGGSSIRLGDLHSDASTSDRIDPKDVRIDVRAKFALQRMRDKRPGMREDALRLIRGVNSGRLAGIYGDDLAIAVKVARAHGKERWQIIPKGEDAALALDPAQPLVASPTIIFRGDTPDISKHPARIDAALQKASQSYQLWVARELAECGSVPGGITTLAAFGAPPTSISVNNVFPRYYCHIPQGTPVPSDVLPVMFGPPGCKALKHTAFTQVMIDLLKSLLDDVVPNLKKHYPLTPAITRLFKITPPANFRYLCKPEADEAFKVFAGSLDLTKILLGDSKGPRGPFTVAVNHPDGWHVVLLMGDLNNWVSNKRRACMLIHELAHAWQSQHHSTNRQAYMWNALKNQIFALTNPLIRDIKGAYAYIRTRRVFGDHAAEQIAQRVQDDYSGRQASPEIMKVITSAKPNERSTENETSLTRLSAFPTWRNGMNWPQPCAL